jgi:hypothetical protein
MPRHKPLPNKPAHPKKQFSSFKFHKTYEYCLSVPCINPRCSSFMFLVTVKYIGQENCVDELECFECKRTRRIGPHDPKRSKVETPSRRPKNDRNRSKRQ